MSGHPVVFNFANPVQASRFPKHGGAPNSYGVKILWLPILGLAPDVVQIRQLRSAQPLKNEMAAIHNAKAFTEPVRRLARTLQGVHRYERLFGEHPPPFGATIGQRGLWYQANDMVPLLVDLAYLYLRRIADRLIVALRPVLFDNYAEAKLYFKDYPDWTSKASNLQSAKPICDVDQLQSAFREQYAWFEILRTTDGDKGVRDVLEHRPVQLIFSTSQVEDQPPGIALTVRATAKDVAQEIDPIATLYNAVAGFCDFCTELYRATGDGRGYLALGTGLTPTFPGDYDDFVGFWPQI